jgi:hypothetical protein
VRTTRSPDRPRFNCEAVALDIDGANLDRARCTVEQVGVDDRVTVHRGDIEQLDFDDLQTTTGLFAMMTPAGFVGDERVGGTHAFLPRGCPVLRTSARWPG